MAVQFVLLPQEEQHVCTVAHMKMTKCLLENLKGRNHLGHLGLDGKIILKWFVTKQSVKSIKLADDEFQ
jgi:hypothetical protein